MTEEPEYTFYDPPPDHKSRRGHILTGGILNGLGGLLLLLTGGFYMAIPMMGALAGGGSSPFDDMFGNLPMKEMMVFSGATFLYYGLILCITSIGSLMLRRWCRVLGLVMAATALYFGLIQVISIILITPAMTNAMMSMEELNDPATGVMPPGGMGAMVGVQIAIQVGMTLIFNVAIPALMLWFYWGRHAIETLQLSDPRPRWTDRCPGPVLAITWVALLMIPLCIGPMLFAPFIYEMMGIAVSNITIYMLSIAVAFLLIYIAWGAFHRQLAAWICTVILTVVWAASGYWFMQKMDYNAFFESFNPMSEALSSTSGLSAEERIEMEEQMKNMNVMMDSMMEAMRTPMQILSAVVFLPILGYLIWVVRYFLKKEEKTEDLLPSSG